MIPCRSVKRKEQSSARGLNNQISKRLQIVNCKYLSPTYLFNCESTHPPAFKFIEGPWASSGGTESTIFESTCRFIRTTGSAAITCTRAPSGRREWFGCGIPGPSTSSKEEATRVLRSISVQCSKGKKICHVESLFRVNYKRSSYR